MYKTVRHGENSLQYTILPQDEHHPSTSSTMKRKRSNRHRTAFILIVTVIVGCGIVAAAVIIPILLTSNFVALPARFQTFAVAASSVKPHGKYNIQGTQYIALLPVKDASGHFNAYQLKPSTLSSTTTTTSSTTSTTTSTTTTTTTSKPTTERTTTTQVLPNRYYATEIYSRKSLLPTLLYTSGIVDKTSDKSPQQIVDTRKPSLSRQSSDSTIYSDQRNSTVTTISLFPFFARLNAKENIICISLIAGALLLSGVAVGCLLSRRRITLRHHKINELTSELRSSDKGTLLADVSGEED